MTDRPRIVAAAIRYRDVVYQLPPPNRHHNIIWHILEVLGEPRLLENEQGFVDESGQFLRRRAALISALENGQVKEPDKIRSGILFSEDLW